MEYKNHCHFFRKLIVKKLCNIWIIYYLCYSEWNENFNNLTYNYVLEHQEWLLKLSFLIVSFYLFISFLSIFNISLFPLSYLYFNPKKNLT